MRNLKKILALVLALVMSMSLVTVANAFSDDESINEAYQEAAEVLAGLKVLQGRPDGSFDPKASVTRGEMAAIIYRIVTTDVEDKQTSIYAESSKLSDVPGTWSAGYVGFCNNSNLIMGYPDGTFQQNKTVTGHEALAMLLRAIGYGKNGEFVGKDWAINTAIYAKMNGLLKNINESTLSQPATREMVAEMAFRALSAEKVNWSLGLNYQKTGETLGDAFNLKEFEGVITANEYADLYDVTPVKAGKTVLDNDVTYTWTTDLTQMGMNYRGWSCGNDNTVIFNEETGNTVAYDGGEAKKVDKVGMNVKEAEYFLNFGTPDYYVSDVRIEYVLDGLTFKQDLTKCADFADYGYASAQAYAEAKLAAKFAKFAKDPAVNYTTDGTDYVGTADFGNTIKANDEISAYDMACMKLIFTEADKEDGIFELGEVYVKTTSEVDVSDEISWKEFVNKYINVKTDVPDYEATENGEWLKVIDNDGDGKADYVFKTEFTVSFVSEIDKKGNIDIYDLDEDTYPIATEDELAEGDVVLFTVIDGTAYVNLPENFQATVKTYSWKDDSITTTDGESFGQSGITKSRFDDRTDEDSLLCIAGLWTELKSAGDDREYIFYKDHFGYVAAFDEVAINNALKLLVDGFYDDGYNKKDIYKVEYWDSEAKDYAIASVDTKTSDEDEFINDNRGSNDGWERLIGANDKRAWTNVAAMGIDGDTASVQNVDKKTNKATEMNVELDYSAIVGKDLDGNDCGGFAAQDKFLTTAYGEIEDGEQTTIMTNPSTVYYYVYFDGDDMYVTEVVGYKNSLKVLDNQVEGVNMIHEAYAVVTDTNAYANGDGSYPVADVVVVETNRPLVGSASLALMYSINMRNNTEVQNVETINNGAEKTYRLSRSDWKDEQYDNLDVFNFYNMIGKDDKATDADKVTTGEYTANRIYAGKINATNGVLVDEDGRYVVMDDSTGKTGLEVPSDTPVITFSKNSSRYNTYSADLDNELTRRNNGDRIIWVEDAAGDVVYIVNVDKSTKDARNSGLTRLYDDIQDTVTPADSYTLTVIFKNKSGTVLETVTKAGQQVGNVLTFDRTDMTFDDSTAAPTITEGTGTETSIIDNDTIKIVLDEAFTGPTTVTVQAGTALNKTITKGTTTTGYTSAFTAPTGLDGAAQSAEVGETVALTATITGTMTADQAVTFVVKTASGKTVPVTMTNVTASAAGSFVMPDENVTVDTVVSGKAEYTITVTGNVTDNAPDTFLAGDAVNVDLTAADGQMITKISYKVDGVEQGPFTPNMIKNRVAIVNTVRGNVVIDVETAPITFTWKETNAGDTKAASQGYTVTASAGDYDFAANEISLKIHTENGTEITGPAATNSAVTGSVTVAGTYALNTGDLVKVSLYVKDAFISTQNYVVK